MGQMLKMIELFKTIGGANSENNEKGDAETPRSETTNQEEVKKTEDIKKIEEKRYESDLPKERTQAEQVRYFDDSIHTNSIKNIKAMVPYMDYNVQKNIAIMVKFFELQKTIEMYNSQQISTASVEESDVDWRRGMLSAVRAHSTEENKNMIDMITTLIDLKEAMEKMKGAKN